MTEPYSRESGILLFAIGLAVGAVMVIMIAMPPALSKNSLRDSFFLLPGLFIRKWYPRENAGKWAKLANYAVIVGIFLGFVIGLIIKMGII